jgi:hypothetical protein
MKFLGKSSLLLPIQLHGVGLRNLKRVVNVLMRLAQRSPPGSILCDLRRALMEK